MSGRFAGKKVSNGASLHMLVPHGASLHESGQVHQAFLDKVPSFCMTAFMDLSLAPSGAMK